MFKSSATCVVLAVLLASAGAMGAVVDQSQLAFNTGDPFEFVSGGNNYPLGQSFTAGLTGQLAEVDLFSNGKLDGSNTVAFELRAGDGTGGAVLGSFMYAVGPNNYDFALAGYPVAIDTTSLGVNVAAGSQYTFLITAVTGPGDLAFRGVLAHMTNPYAGGRAYHGPAGYGDTPDWDLMFRTHVVPEPGSIALCSIAMLGFLARRRR